VRKNVFIAISIILFILVAVFSFQNTTAVSLSFFGMQSQLPLAAVSFGNFVLGALAAMSLWTIQTVKQQVSEQKQIEWQKQDEKLALEIQSDKEKQLEAKIATLEQALKAALDKQKRKTQDG